jgi:hypothetical protein
MAKPIIILVLILRLVKNPNSPAEALPEEDEVWLTVLFLGSGNGKIRNAGREAAIAPLSAGGGVAQRKRAIGSFISGRSRRQLHARV